MKTKILRLVFLSLFVTLSLLYSVSSLHAQTGIGTWVRQPDPKMPGDITMIVEACCNGGRRLTYRIKIGNETQVMVVESAFNGMDAQVLLGGKPSGETMAIQRIDDYHWTAVVKLNGQTFGTSRGTLSADQKTITVENDFTAATPFQAAGKQTEVWTKK